jgi:hypothetical protein
MRYDRTLASGVALSEALKTVSHDRLTRWLQAAWSGPTRLELAWRTLFVWERGDLILDDTVIPQPVATAIAGLAWGFSSPERQPVDGLSLAELARTITWPALTSRPPLTFDDTLRYTRRRVAGVPVIASDVEGTARVDVGLAFDLQGVPPRLYRYLPLLPGLIRSVGLREGPAVTPYHDLDERVQREFYGLDVAYRTNPAAHRYELVITAAGVGIWEFRAALETVRQITHDNDLHLDNLSRIDALLAHAVTAEEAVTQQPEEDWVEAFATAFRYQTHHLFLSLSAQPTRAHHLQRLRWLLTGPVAPEALRELRAFAATRLAPLHTLSVEAIAQTLAHGQETGLKRQLVDDWRASLPKLPPAAVGESLQRLTEEVLSDLQVGTAQAMADMRELQAIILNRAQLRVWMVGDPAVLAKTHTQLAALVRSFPLRPRRAAPVEAQPVVVHRLQARQAVGTAGYPWYVGYVRADASTGAIVITAKGPDYRQAGPGGAGRGLGGEVAGRHGPAHVVQTHLGSGARLWQRPGCAPPRWYRPVLCGSVSEHTGHPGVCARADAGPLAGPGPGSPG